jgi:hypothetical protein
VLITGKLRKSVAKRPEKTVPSAVALAARRKQTLPPAVREKQGFREKPAHK